MACFRRPLNFNRAIMVTQKQTELLSYLLRSRRLISDKLSDYISTDSEHDIIFSSMLNRVNYYEDVRLSYSYVNYISRLMEDWRLGAELEVNTTKAQCVICLAEDANYIIRPCNHLALCAHCNLSFISEFCPICRELIMGIERIYD